MLLKCLRWKFFKFGFSLENSKLSAVTLCDQKLLLKICKQVTNS